MIWLGLFALLLILVSLFSIKRPGVAVGLVLAMFGVEQFLQTRSTLFIDRGNLVNMGIGFVALIAAGFWLLNNMNRLKFDKIQIACLLLILLSQASRFWTIAPAEFAQYYGRSPLPYYALYFLIAPILTQDKNATGSGIWATVYIGIPLVFLMVFFVEWDGRGIQLAKAVMHKGRLRSFTPPLALASLASYIAIMCIVLKPKKVLWKMLHLVGFGLAAYVVYRTQSRGQLVALACVTLIAYPLANQATQIKGLLLTLGGFVVIGLVLYLVFSQFDLGGVNRWNEASIRKATEGRYYMISSLLQEWSSSGPLYLFFGLGSAAGWTTSGFAVHNFPAEVLGELGLIGFSIYMYINIRTLANSIKIIGKLKHYPEIRGEAVVLIALFTFSCLLSIKSISLFSSAPLMLYFAIMISQLERHSRKFAAERFNWKNLLIVSEPMQHSSMNQPGYQPVYR